MCDNLFTMGKRKSKEEKAERIRQKLKKWQKRLKKNEEDGCLTPTDSPPRERAVSVEPLTSNLDMPLSIISGTYLFISLLLIGIQIGT